MMDIYGKTEAVKQWATTWDEFNGYLKLNATTSELGESSLITNFNDIVVSDNGVGFIDDTARRRYMFKINLILDWSDGYNDVNLESMKYASKLLDWINDQFADENLPDFENAIITGIETDQNLPSLEVTFPEESLALYTIAARINYIE